MPNLSTFRSGSWWKLHLIPIKLAHAVSGYVGPVVQSVAGPMFYVVLSVYVKIKPCCPFSLTIATLLTRFVIGYWTFVVPI